jgi:hypothetical protein
LSVAWLGSPLPALGGHPSAVSLVQVGCLLGKGGSIITDLRRQSEAQIRVMPREALPKCARRSDELVQVRSSVIVHNRDVLLFSVIMRCLPLCGCSPASRSSSVICE